MMMAIAGLLQNDLVEWMTCMTYQSASGAGAQNMRELLQQMGEAHLAAKDLLDDPASSILDIDREVAGILRAERFPTGHSGVPLAGSLIPWIADDMGDGVSKEEWKGGAETNKILGRTQASDPGRVDLRARRRDALPQPGADDQAASRPAACRTRAADRVGQRVGARRSQHARGEHARSDAGGGYRQARHSDRPAAQAGDGRPRYLGAFTVGDQLLWGAAEPLRRMLRILRRPLSERSRRRATYDGTAGAAASKRSFFARFYALALSLASLGIARCDCRLTTHCARSARAM